MTTDPAKVRCSLLLRSAFGAVIAGLGVALAAVPWASAYDMLFLSQAMLAFRCS